MKHSIWRNMLLLLLSLQLVLGMQTIPLNAQAAQDVTAEINFSQRTLTAGNITALFRIDNADGGNNEILTGVAVYHDNRLVDSRFTKHTIDSSGITYIQENIEIAELEPGENSLKAFCWDAATQEPLTDVKALAEEGEYSYKDFSVIISSDVHYNADNLENEAQTAMFPIVNQITSYKMPDAVGGGYPNSPAGMFIVGDVTENTDEREWQQFYDDYIAGTGLNGLPVWPMYGNHDTEGRENSPVIKGIRQIVEENMEAGNLTDISDNGYHYSMDINGVHFIAANLYGGAATGRTHDPYDSLAFIQRDLKENIGSSGRPVVLLQHYGFDSFVEERNDWTEAEMDALYQVIKDYNIIAIFHGHSHKYAAYEWNGINVYNDDAMKNGAFLVVNFPDGEKMQVLRRGENSWWSYTQKEISIKPVEKILDSGTVITAEGAAPALPATVTVQLGDGTQESREVKWDRIDESQLQSAGRFEVYGSISGSSLFAQATVQVIPNTVLSIEEVSAETVVGTAPKLPATVKVHYEGDYIVDMPVEWDAIDPALYSKTGDFDVSGTVAHTDKKANAHVVVGEPEITAFDPVTVETMLKFPPALPSKVTAVYNSGETAEVDVQWEDIQPAAYETEGSFSVKGSVAGTSVQPVANVTVKRNNEAFIVVSNPGYVTNPGLDFTNRMYALQEKVKTVDEDFALPDVIGGTLGVKPSAFFMNGDITYNTNGGLRNFQTDFGLENGNPVFGDMPIYLGYSENDTKDQRIVDYIKTYNQRFTDNYTAISADGAHYSLDLNGLHIIQLNIYGGSTWNADPDKAGAETNDPNNSLQFLIDDLRTNVGSSGKPVLIFNHYAPGGDSSAWTAWEWQQMSNALEGYNIVEIVTGHSSGGYTGQADGYDWFRTTKFSNETEFTVFQIVQDEQGGSTLRIMPYRMAQGSDAWSFVSDGIVTKEISYQPAEPSGITGFKEQPEAETIFNVQPELPERITAVYADGNTAEVPVVWNQLTSEQLLAEDVYTVFGTVSGTALRPSATVTVKRNNEVFVVASSPRYGTNANGTLNTRISDLIQQVNSIDENFELPEDVGGGPLGTKPSAFFMLGHLTRNQEGGLARFRDAFGLEETPAPSTVFNGIPMYLGYGREDAQRGSEVLDYVKAYNKTMAEHYTAMSADGAHYSIDFKGIHVIQLNLYGGSTWDADPNKESGKESWNDPNHALQFLIDDLRENVGASGKPVLIFNHYTPAGDANYWTGSNSGYEWTQMRNALEGYNVAAIFTSNGNDGYNSVQGGYRIYRAPHIAEVAEFVLLQIVQNDEGESIFRIIPYRQTVGEKEWDVMVDAESAENTGSNRKTGGIYTTVLSSN